jgi:hypothetical protein
VPVLKQIVALPGQQVCIRNSSVYVDGIAVARTLNEGGKLQALASWKASRPLVDGQISAEFPPIGRSLPVAILTRSTCHSYAVELCIYDPSTD